MRLTREVGNDERNGLIGWAGFERTEVMFLMVNDENQRVC